MPPMDFDFASNLAHNETAIDFEDLLGGERMSQLPKPPRPMSLGRQPSLGRQRSKGKGGLMGSNFDGLANAESDEEDEELVMPRRTLPTKRVDPDRVTVRETSTASFELEAQASVPPLATPLSEDELALPRKVLPTTHLRPSQVEDAGERI